MVNVMTIAMGITVTALVLQIARNLHNKMASSVSRAPVSFFDSNPMGRVLNRFSKDIAVIDTQFTFLLTFFLQIGGQMIVSVVLSLRVVPIMVGMLVLLFIVMLVLKKQVTTITNESLRWDAITRSPINSLLSATLCGLFTIRAFKQEFHFLRRFYHLLD